MRIENFTTKLRLLFILALLLTVELEAKENQANNPDTDWMSGNWGIGFHYLQDKFPETMKGGSKEWNDAVNNFDVNKFADGVQRSGANWALFTMGQNSGYYCAPNATLDKYSGYKAGERNSTRDLIKDIAQALKARGLRLVIYLPSNAPANDSKIANGLGLTTLNGGNWVVNDTFLKRWSEVITEWSMRYGADVSGWWFDGWYGGSGFKDAYGKYYSDAVRAGNPKGVFCVNTGLNGNGLKLGSNYADYSALEARDLNYKCTNRWIKSSNGAIGPLQWATFTLLGGGWWVEGSKDRYTEAQVRGYMDTTHTNGGAITWATYVDVKGNVSERQIALLQKAAPHADNKAPSVSIASPANNASFTAPASVAITANAVDSDGSISKVEFYNGSTLLGSVTASPYSYTWSNVAIGSYTIKAKATDNAGATTTSTAVSINVTCSPTAIKPYIQTNGGTWQNSSSATVNAGSSVKFGPQPTSGGSWSWSGPNGFAATTREVTITNIQSSNGGDYIATYTNSGGCKSTATLTVTVNSTNAAPTVSITSPANNSSSTEGSTITIKADASDSDGTVSKVEFFNGTTKLGEDASSPYEFGWTNVAAGTYSLTAIATDNSGVTTTSTAVNVTVTAIPNTAPSVSITSPANNTSFDEGASITINANASDSDGSVAKVEFFNGTTKLGEDATSPYSVTWTGAAIGTYSITAKATDNKGATTTTAAVTVIVKASANPCTGTPTYVENGGYVAGSKVQNAGGMYQCKPYPYSGWCNGAAWAYAPGTGTYWTDAWDKVGICSAKKGMTNGAENANTENTNALTILPNPTNQATTIKLNADGVYTAEYSVINSLGVEVVRGTMNGNMEQIIDLSGMTNGIYTVRISGGGNVWMNKIIKQ